MEPKEEVKWENLSTVGKKTVEKYIVPIYRWIEQNKHNYTEGITQSTYFASAVPKTKESGYFDPREIRAGTPTAGKFYNLICNLRRRGYLRRGPVTPGGPWVWTVNEAVLPPGTVSYTGVSYTIPTTPSPEPANIVKSETPPQETKTEAARTAEAFIEAELKSIKIQTCQLGRRIDCSVFNNPSPVQVRLEDVTLWDIYKIGLAVQNTLGTEFNGSLEKIKDTPETMVCDVDDYDDDELEDMEVKNESMF